MFVGSVHSKKAAIKLFRPDADDRRLNREIEALSEISCRNLPKVLAFTVIDLSGVSCAVVAYEYFAGGDLLGLLSNSAPMVSARSLFSIGAEVGEALEALWQRRIVHRDVKPANIVKADDGRYVLVDIGVARHLDLSDLTAAGFACGSPGYMSPEQAQGRKQLTITSDVFSLGVTLYELATKKHPFDRRQHLVGSATVAPISASRTDLPSSFARLVERMLSLRAWERPAKIVREFDQIRTAIGGS